MWYMGNLGDKVEINQNFYYMENDIVIIIIIKISRS